MIQTESIAQTLGQLMKRGQLPILTLPGEEEDLKEIEQLPLVTGDDYDHVVVVGIGGSSLGAQVLASIGPKTHPVLHFWDTLDYHVMAPHLTGNNLARTAFLLISKSGSTPEILAQSLLVVEALNKFGGKEAVSRQVLVICEPGSNPLGRIADKWGIKRLDHNPDVGGRYSVFSVVGALPAILAGIDMRMVRRGAKEVLDNTFRTVDAAPRVGAALHHALHEIAGVSMNVMMPYSKQLEPMTHWFRQLWAESIGKEGRGTTPLNALGPIDQHSQLQLWLDGPNDKFFTLIINNEQDTSPLMDVGLASNDEALDYLKDHHISEVVQAEASATAETLAMRGKFLRRMEIGKLDERTLGALLMHFMLETIFACYLLGVNPFDQPAVEDGKRLTKMYLKGKA
ncbi:glucose-6-phosphate isomerase [Sneathiella chinensis]|uniref:glucose-6-phosphate isomerase n=1 Tax=Sneathiella chinensis TaxID=349750 RepID=UPI00146C11AA|nr:glucose-6-phosphate isomerase [Sneathiella chinensis]